MFRRLRKALVQSFVGAIGVGLVLAYGISAFGTAISAPFWNWVASKEYCGNSNAPQMTAGFPFKTAVPGLVQCFLLLLVGYVLLRWLYYKPIDDDKQTPAMD